MRQNSRGSEEGDELLPPLRTKKLGWLAPLGLLLVALFFQNAGLFLGTRCYVRWMDELADPVPSTEAEQPAASGAGTDGATPHAFRPASVLQAALTLRDPLGESIRGLKLEMVSGPWGAEFWVDLMSSLVAALWGGWVARTRDLRLWTKVLVAGSVLACLKGFLAWSTVLPDAAGWDRCRHRLGPDGLMYYRELSSGGSNSDEHVDLLQAILDIALLELRGLWMMGRSGRQEICADTILSSPTCFCSLFAASLFDAVRASTEPMASTKRATMLALAGSILFLVLLADMLLTVATAHHYTVDVVVAVPLTLMMYSSPAVAVAAEWWAVASELPEEGAEDVEAQQTVLHHEGSEPIAVKDLGYTTVPPCCIPFCSLGGMYYLRGAPGTHRRPPWNEEAKKQYMRQVAEFTQIRARDAGRLRQVGEALDEARRRAQQRSAESQAAAERAELQQQHKEQQLRQDEDRIVAETNQRVDKFRLATRQLEELRMQAETNNSIAESACRELNIRLQGDTLAARNKSLEAKNGMLAHSTAVQQYAKEAEALRTLLGQLRERMETHPEDCCAAAEASLELDDDAAEAVSDKADAA